MPPEFTPNWSRRRQLLHGRRFRFLPLIGHALSSPFSAQNRFPQLEQTPVFNSINFLDRADDTRTLRANLTAMTTVVDTFLCPIDRTSTVKGYGRTNYRFCTGPSPSATPASGRPGSAAGAFTSNRSYSPADFTDGLSQTVGGSERLQGDWTRGVFRSGGDYYFADIPGNSKNADPDVAIVACSTTPLDTPVESRGGESWFLRGFHMTSYNHVATPNPQFQSCLFGKHSVYRFIHNRTIHNGVMAATSAHRGGVHVVLMDGSVKFTRDEINKQVWRAISTRNGGETVSGDY